MPEIFSSISLHPNYVSVFKEIRHSLQDFSWLSVISDDKEDNVNEVSKNITAHIDSDEAADDENIYEAIENESSESEDEQLVSSLPATAKNQPATLRKTWRGTTIFGPKLRLYDDTFPSQAAEEKKLIKYFQQYIDDEMYKLMA